MQIRTIGKPSIDHVLSQIVERYEAQFPGRIRAYYLTGSYAEGNAVEWSDIDVYVLSAPMLGFRQARRRRVG